MNRRVPVVYNDRDTVIHRRDPRAKLVALVVLLSYVYLAPTWEWMLAGALLGVAMVVVARVPPKWVAGLFVIQIPNAFTYLALPALSRFLAGEPPLVGDFSFALKVVLSWWVALFVSVSLLTTMELTELTDGLRGLGVPEIAAFTFEYVLLLFYLTISDLFRIVDGLTVRGVELETRNPVTLVRNVPKLGIPMFLAVLRRSNTMMAVLKMRGYSFTERGELRTALKFDGGDAALVAFAVCVAGGTALVNVGVVDATTLLDGVAAALGW